MYVLIRCGRAAAAVSDITYIGSRGSHTYLCLVTDAYSKKIVGYDLSDSLSAEGSIRALKMAVKQKGSGEPPIHHSDRGLQYCCDGYQRLLGKHGIKCSMTESYDPYANAVAERVNGILKDEFILEEYRADMKTMKKLMTRPEIAICKFVPLIQNKTIYKTRYAKFSKRASPSP